MEKPEVYILTRLNWQFFGTLTFRSAAMPERVRLTMWFSLMRKLSATLGLHFPSLPWCLRQEDGETNGRRHFHYLLGGLPRRAVTKSTCFATMANWECLGGGMARVRIFNPALNGVGYITDCLGMAGADVYESAKFGSSTGLMLSKAAEAMLLRGIREERRFIERQEKTIDGRKVSKAKSPVWVPQRNRQEAAEFLSRGHVRSTGYAHDLKSFKANPCLAADLVDIRADVKS